MRPLLWRRRVSLFSRCLLLLSLILHSSRVKKEKNIAENVNENTYFFYLCLSVSVVLACISSGAQSPLPVFSLLMYSSVCTFSPPVIMFCHFLSFKTLCAFLCLFSLFAGTVCWGRTGSPVQPVWLVSGTTLNLMIMI